jgi:CBS domain-containing protein
MSLAGPGSQAIRSTETKGTTMNQVADAMTRGVRTVCPSDNLVQAAQAMTELDIGALPVCDGDRLVGMITDRDIVVRGVAQGQANDRMHVAEVMTEEAAWCYDDDKVEEVLDRMRALQIRRLPVVDRHKRLVGMLSLGDIAVKATGEDTGEALKGISDPSEPAC